MATTMLVSIDGYLGKTYRPDVEYIDGELRERPMIKRVHGRLQALISWIAVKRFEVAGTAIYMNLEDFFARLDRAVKT